jgi:hypothetical protein
MAYMADYFKKSPQELDVELKKLIKEYNAKRGTYLIIYASAIGKPIPDIPMSKDDYYTFYDILKDVKSEKIDIFIETPGGNADAAEEIGNYLHDKFKSVSFVISGEAKSAGTILVLSGDEILMTNTGSLGPIDAQILVGRSRTSAYDYIEWINGKRKEAESKGVINPFDAIVVAQISPGELCSVYHALKYSEDLIKEWLPKYKFKSWTVTEERGVAVTEEMRTQRAEEIAKKLINHAEWRTHGRSIKIKDLESIKLKITRVDEDPILSEIVYRIHTLVRILFASTPIYKLFATESDQFVKNAIEKDVLRKAFPIQTATSIEMDVNCPKCGKNYKLYAKFIDDPNIDKVLSAKGAMPFPKDSKLHCECGSELDLTAMRKEIETKFNRKMMQ